MQKFRKEKYIKQRYSKTSNRWSFQVSFEYFDLDGVQQSYTKTFAEKNFKTAKDALNEACKHRDKMRHKLNTEGLPKKQTFTLKEVFNLTTQLFILRKETVIKLEKNFKKYILTELGDIDFKKISALSINRTLNQMVSTASDDTIKRVFSIWKKLFKTARVHKIVMIDITDEIIVPKSEVKKVKKKVNTSYNDLLKIIDTLRKSTRQTKKYIFETEVMIYGLLTIYYTGLRPAECFALKKGNIDLINNIIYIDEEIGSSYTELNVLRETKTEDSVREIPIVPKLKKILQDAFRYQYEDAEFLFSNYEKQLFDIDTITNKITRCAKKINIKFNMYMLRHLFSTDLIVNKTDPRTVMELMGHNNVAMTIEYARSNSDLKVKALSKRKLS